MSTDTWRKELATVLETDPERLVDHARLVEDLHLDSLAMLSVRAWLEGNGVRLDGHPGSLLRIGDVLELLAHRPAMPGVSVTIVESPVGTPTATVRSPVRPVGDELAPILDNAAVRLTPVDPADAGFLYSLAVRPETGFRWRYRGAPPSTERFAADLWAQVLVQYVVREASDGEPMGHVVAYGAELAQGHCFLGAVFLPGYSGTGVAAEAVTLFARHLFHTFPLRKVYLEVPGFNWNQIASGEGAWFMVEGVLRDHDYYAGRYWDKRLCAIYPLRADPAGVAETARTE